MKDPTNSNEDPGTAATRSSYWIEPEVRCRDCGKIQRFRIEIPADQDAGLDTWTKTGEGGGDPKTHDYDCNGCGNRDWALTGRAFDVPPKTAAEQERQDLQKLFLEGMLTAALRNRQPVAVSGYLKDIKRMRLDPVELLANARKSVGMTPIELADFLAHPIFQWFTVVLADAAFMGSQ